METATKEKIKSLATNGYGLRAIAEALCLSKDTVKSFCRRQGIKIGPTKGNEKVGNGVFCLNCGKALEQTKGKRRKVYCSEKCKNEWWNKRHRELGGKATYSLVCKGCGKEFKSYGNAKRKYCSHGCYIKHRFKEAENE